MMNNQGAWNDADDKHGVGDSVYDTAHWALPAAAPQRHPHITGDRGPSVPTSRTVRAFGGATVWPWALGLPLAPVLAA